MSVYNYTTFCWLPLQTSALWLDCTAGSLPHCADTYCSQSLSPCRLPVASLRGPKALLAVLQLAVVLKEVGGEVLPLLHLA